MTRYEARPDRDGYWSLTLPVTANPEPTPREGLFRRLRRRVWGFPVPPQPWGGWSDTPRVDDQCCTCGVPVTVHADTVQVAAERCARWLAGHRSSTDCREGLLAWRMSGMRPWPVVLDRDGRQHTGRMPAVIQPEPDEPGLDIMRRRLR